MNERFICVYLTVHEPQVFISSLNRCHNTQQHNYNLLSARAIPLPRPQWHNCSFATFSSVYHSVPTWLVIEFSCSAQIKPWTGWMELSVTSSNQQYSQESFNCLHCSLAPVSHTGPFLQHTHVTKQQIYNKQINTQTDTSPSGFSQRNPEHHVNQNIIQI